MFITVTWKKFSFQATMHSLQGCFFDVFIEGNMPDSRNLKYYAKSLKRNKAHSHNITKLFKRSRSENIENEQQTEEKFHFA